MTSVRRLARQTRWRPADVHVGGADAASFGIDRDQTGPVDRRRRSWTTRRRLHTRYMVMVRRTRRAPTDDNGDDHGHDKDDNATITRFRRRRSLDCSTRRTARTPVAAFRRRRGPGRGRGDIEWSLKDSGRRTRMIFKISDDNGVLTFKDRLAPTSRVPKDRTKSGSSGVGAGDNVSTR